MILRSSEKYWVWRSFWVRKSLFQLIKALPWHLKNMPGENFLSSVLTSIGSIVGIQLADADWRVLKVQTLIHFSFILSEAKCMHSKIHGLSTVRSRNCNFRFSWQKLSLVLLLEYILQNHGVERTRRAVTFIQSIENRAFS